MKIGKDIEYDFGGVLIPEGTILDSNKIKKIKNLDIKSVFVHNEEKSQIEENLKRIKSVNQDYQNNKEEMKSMFKRVRNNDEIEYKELRNSTYKVTTLGNDMVYLLTKVRKVDEYTYSHLLNVGMLAYMFSKWLNLEEEESIKLTQAGLLHDMGKAYVPDEILNKPGKLTAEEYEKIKNTADMVMTWPEKMKKYLKKLHRVY